ncbi:hypothetical protein PGT21_013496 [Puccinia graminis f. sp. tritici]|uniref:Uncharacterized protein n=1 Tax=Puccinia graminis f. sp. tritici TaxID=56615 RepID=A0A5B0QAP5_PUCGR|nr:hypothetical protein PGT21_013496 [Puccinia graminis f. sp. tritici]
MNLTKNTENLPAQMVSQSSGLKSQPGNRYRSASPSPVPIRKSRPLQSLNSNQVSRRAFGDENKENYRQDNVCQRPTGNGKIDTTAVLLQPPTHASLSTEGLQSQPGHHPLIPKSTFQQVQLGGIPIPTQWNSTEHRSNDPMHFANIDNALCHTSDFMPSPAFVQGEMDGHEVDPFSQLSAHTLALMDQPESEVTIYDCEYCEKTYQGKHARSIWRRHLSDKHKIPLSTQPRRTRWDNDANRPKTEEERRERTLESKRRWARKNRAAKKAAREGQKNSMEQASAMMNSQSLPYNLMRGAPGGSQVPSPALYPSSHGYTAGSPDYFTGVESHAHNQSSLQVHPSRSSVSTMSRGSSVSQSFSHRPPLPSQTPHPISSAPYNPSFPINQGTAPAEWTFQPAGSKASSYSFGNYSAGPDAHSPFQISDRFANEGNHPSYSPQSSQNHSLRQSPPTSYGGDVIRQDLAHPELPDCYASAPLNFQYHSWELGGRFNFGTALTSPSEPMEPLSYESHAKRPRLSLPSPIPRPIQQFDELRKSYGACNVEALSEAGNFQPVSSQEPAISSNEVAQVGSKRSSLASARDEEATSESGSIVEHHTSSQHEVNYSYGNLASTINPHKQFMGELGGQYNRPATAGNFTTLAHDQEYSSVAPPERAATEPHFSVPHDLQTPLRESALRSDGRLHFSHSPMGRMDAAGLDQVDLLSSPAVSQADMSAMSLYHGHYAPMSAGKRRSSENYPVQPLSSSCPLNAGDWGHQALQTPSGLSRFPFNNSMGPSPAGGVFGSPHNLLSKSLGLTLTNTEVSGEDSLGGLLVGSSPWDIVHQRT